MRNACAISKDALFCSYTKTYIKTKHSRNKEKDVHVEHTKKGEKNPQLIRQH